MTWKNKNCILVQLNAITERGDPQRDEYKNVLEYAALLRDMVNEGVLLKQKIHATLNTGELFSDKNSLIGNMNLEHPGYINDYQAIDQPHIKGIGNSTYLNWDLFVIEQSVAVAVRKWKILYQSDQ
ncbi:MAG TPA: hypothetical protein VN040_27085 [Pseudosphingobacterium sp.]|nr:hypothetical protein [Pseudosphingobacterium sp.]